MRILLINPPYQTITSNIGVGHQVPLGLLMVGGPLCQAGHAVKLLDAECHHLSLSQIVQATQAFNPDLVMTGHAGSLPAHPVCIEMLRALKQACPTITTVYGGVYPSYHAHHILATEPSVDIIIRGEGEATTAALVAQWAADKHAPLNVIWGLSYRGPAGEPIHTPPRPPIQELDAWPVGWNLIEDWDHYQCFGLGRAAIVQFSRGCPHRCTYCGQHNFWTKWRHRTPETLVDEIEHLYHTHNIRFFTLADENPTTVKTLWQRFLTELAGRQLPVYFFATIRATDIVRDADILPLYRQAGLLYVLMGIDTTNPETLTQIRKGSTTRDDYQACQLLRQHGIFSILGHVVGFEEESWETLGTALQQLLHYDGDYLNAMYATPHAWTPFAQESQGRAVVQWDQRKWDYRHQILAQRHLKPWQLFAYVKWMELCFHLHPRKLQRLLTAATPFQRRQYAWTGLHTGMVWLAEVVEFLVATSFIPTPTTLSAHATQMPAPPLPSAPQIPGPSSPV